MSLMYSLGSILGQVLSVNILGIKIAAGMVEWGLLLGVISFIINVMLSAMGYRRISVGMTRFIRTVITAPVIEEIIFRLVLISVFSMVFNSVLVAIVISAVLFALAHLLYGGLTFIDCLITGLIWGWAFINLGVGVTIIAHMTHNFIVSVL